MALDFMDQFNLDDLKDEGEELCVATTSGSVSTPNTSVAGGSTAISSVAGSDAPVTSAVSGTEEGGESEGTREEETDLDALLAMAMRE